MTTKFKKTDLAADLEDALFLKARITAQLDDGVEEMHGTPEVWVTENGCPLLRLTGHHATYEGSTTASINEPGSIAHAVDGLREAAIRQGEKITWKPETIRVISNVYTDHQGGE